MQRIRFETHPGVQPRVGYTPRITALLWHRIDRVGLGSLVRFPGLVIARSTGWLQGCLAHKNAHSP
jgi:hypothetical protein